MTKASRKSEPYFEIRGYVGGADHALCALAKGEVEARRMIGQLLEHQDVLFLEILRFNTPKTTEAEIRNSIGRWPQSTASDDEQAALAPHGGTLH